MYGSLGVSSQVQQGIHVEDHLSPPAECEGHHHEVFLYTPVPALVFGRFFESMQSMRERPLFHVDGPDVCPRLSYLRVLLHATPERLQRTLSVVKLGHDKINLG